MPRKTDLHKLKQFVTADYSRVHIPEVKLFHTHDVNFTFAPVYLPIGFSETHNLHHKHSIPIGHSIEYHEGNLRLDIVPVITGDDVGDRDTDVILSVDNEEVYRTRLFLPIPTDRSYMRIAVERLLLDTVNRCNEEKGTMYKCGYKQRQFVDVIVGEPRAEFNTTLPVLFDVSKLDITIENTTDLLRNYIESYDCSYLSHRNYTVTGHKTGLRGLIVGLFLARPTVMKDTTYGKLMGYAIKEARESSSLVDLPYLDSVFEGIHRTLEAHNLYDVEVNEFVSLRDVSVNLQAVVNALRNSDDVGIDRTKEHDRIVTLSSQTTHARCVREIRRVMAGWVGKVEIN